MKLSGIKLDENKVIELMVKRNKMDDYLFNNYFITFLFTDVVHDPEAPRESDKTFVSYLYRLLWETVFVKNKETSSHELVNDTMKYYIKCSLSEVLQFLDLTVPPALKKGRKIIECIDELSEIIGTCKALFEDPHTAATNYSFFYDVMKMKQFDWRMDYNIKRVTMITELLKQANDDKSKSLLEKGVVSDMTIGSMNLNDSPEVLIAFTFNKKQFDKFAKLTQKDMVKDGYHVTGVSVYGNVVTIQTVVSLNKIDPILYAFIRDVYETIEEESNK